MIPKGRKRLSLFPIPLLSEEGLAELRVRKGRRIGGTLYPNKISIYRA
jgi:hypothetical protein